MPDKPRKKESQSSYMSRCVKVLKSEGKKASKAKEICAAVWFKHKKKR